MSDTKKEGKRAKIVKSHAESPEIREAMFARHMWGSTEKILRRNRKLWVRLANKRRRVLDKLAVDDGGTVGF